MSSLVFTPAYQLARMIREKTVSTKEVIEAYLEQIKQHNPKINAIATLIDIAIAKIYQPINNGVYRAGFASTQTAYEQAVKELFSALDYWEEILGQQPYLCGELITLADWCLFTTLFRFDLAYHGIFKCNLKRLVDYSNSWNYCRSLYQQPGVTKVCNISHVKDLYYRGISEINPNGIVPIGAAIDFNLNVKKNQVNAIC